MDFNATEMKDLNTALKTAFQNMQDNLKRAQDAADKALDESKKLGGTIEAKTADTLKAIDENRAKVQEEFIALRQRVVEAEQKLAARAPGSGGGNEPKSLAEIIQASPEWKSASALGRMAAVNIGSFHKTQIVNATGQNQPLVPDQRVPGLIVPAEQRLYIRDLLPQLPPPHHPFPFPP